MVQSHDNDWFYILLCDFQLRTKKFYYHIHIAHFITRDFTHHELTQDKIDCRIIDSITISKRLQPCLHLLYCMDITLQDLLLQRLRHLTIVFLLRTSAILEQAQMVLGLASVILIFFIFVFLNTITLFSISVSCLEAGSCHFCSYLTSTLYTL